MSVSKAYKNAEEPDQRRCGSTASPIETLKASLLDIFPLAFLVDREGHLGSLGKFFRERHGHLLGCPLTIAFSSPSVPGDVDLGDYLRSCPGKERVDLNFLPPNQPCQSAKAASPPSKALHLSGTVISTGLHEEVMFLGTIAPREASNLVHLGLSIRDFGPADPTPEFAMMAEVNASMLADSQLMNKQLTSAHEKAVATQRELEQHRDGLEALVQSRTAIIERQAAELKEALEQEQQLSALQRSFVSMASHEFRTPLAIIDGYARKIERRAADMTTEAIVDHIGKVRNTVKRMMVLMESTLSVAKREAGKISINPVPIDIRAVLLDCCQTQQELTAKHKIMVDHHDLPDQIVADPTSISQILANLLSNAIKYSPEADQIEVRGWQEANDVLISVKDYGIGIDQEDQDQMFARFFRAKTSIGIPGTGIGLNLALMLAEEHEGTIALASIKNEGSIFTIKLPQNQNAQPEAHEDIRRTQASP